MKTTSINISVPSGILLTLRENDKQLALDMKRYTALKLFNDRKLSVGQCAELSEMPEEDFLRFLGENSVSLFDYSSQGVLREDMTNA